VPILLKDTECRGGNIMDAMGALVKTAQTETDVGIKVLKKAQDMASQDMKLIDSMESGSPSKEVCKGGSIDFTA
jgi:hypothetical protein